MSARFRIAVLAAASALAAHAAFAGGIAPGLWRITSRTETGGVIGPPHETLRCISVDQAQDLASTFTPRAAARDSGCAPAEHSLSGQTLTWRLACKGQTDMEQTGEFIFDGPRRYTATIRTHASVAGKPMIDAQDMLEGQWISECR
jgi:hypothetical protein